MDEAKKAAGRKAAEWIKDGMIVGLGTGTTAAHFIQALIERKLNIQAVASSRASAELAKKGNIPLLDINSVPRIDITVDGADEIDPKKRMIKGAGGALLREKVLANASGEMVVIVDESKLVDRLGRAKLPVEVLFYGSPSIRSQIEKLGHQGKWRQNSDGTLFVTENGNLLFDLFFDTLLPYPEETHDILRRIPGVIDTGFFFNLAGRVIVGYPDGKITVK